MARLVLAVLLLLASVGLAGADEYVRGYLRRDGTYVRPYVRSSPDNSRWNNYGRPSGGSRGTSAWGRDYDRDGTLNRFDMDDDNDGTLDDYE